MTKTSVTQTHSNKNLVPFNLNFSLIGGITFSGILCTNTQAVSMLKIPLKKIGVGCGQTLVGRLGYLAQKPRGDHFHTAAWLGEKSQPAGRSGGNMKAKTVQQI